MLDHISINVTDYAAAKAFYALALAPLGYTVLRDFGVACGLGANEKPDFWLTPAKGTVQPSHIAFAAPDRATVDAFYAAALAAGARDNGAPGLRPQYHPAYYGAFVIGPDGNNVEAVCHRRE